MNFSEDYVSSLRTCFAAAKTTSQVTNLFGSYGNLLQKKFKSLIPSTLAEALWRTNNPSPGVKSTLGVVMAAADAA